MTRAEVLDALTERIARAMFDQTWRAGTWDEAGNGPRGHYRLLARAACDVAVTERGGDGPLLVTLATMEEVTSVVDLSKQLWFEHEEA